MIESFLALIELFEKKEIDFCVIGGIAILLYGGRASTLDFDFYVLASDKAKVVQVLAGKGIRVRSAGEDQMKGKFENLPLDILIADDWVGKPALKRARMVAFSGKKVPVATPEDLIIMKTLADRPIDRRDIEELREIFGKKIDQKYIARRLRLIQKAML